MIPKRAEGVLRRRDGWIALLAFGGVIAYVVGAAVVGEAGFPLDDAWIHQTVARNLAHTGQWAFVPGEPSTASTSPLYTLLLSVGYALGVPFLGWTTFLGGGALALAGMVAARLAERLVPETRHIGLVTGLAVVSAWHLIWAGASGMETLLFATWTLLLVALAWRELDAPPDAPMNLTARRGLIVGLVGAAATLTRPEGIGALGLVGLGMWLARPQGAWRGMAAWSLGLAAGWALGIAPYALFSLNLSGGLLPNTAAAKQAEYAILLQRPYLTRVVNMLVPILVGGQFMLLPGVAVAVAGLIGRWRQERTAVLLLSPLAWAVALIGLYAARLPATYQHGRYVIPALPPLIIYGVAGTASILRRGGRTMLGRVLGRGLAVAAALLFVAFWVVGWQQYGRDVQIIQSEMVVTARWVEDHLPPEDLLAVHDIGAVGYYAPRSILDLAGLVSPEVVPIIRDGEALWALIQERSARYLMAFPDQIPGQDPSDPRLCPVFSSGGTWAPQAGGANMAVYALAWDGECASASLE